MKACGIGCVGCEAFRNKEVPMVMKDDSDGGQELRLNDNDERVGLRKAKNEDKDDVFGAGRWCKGCGREKCRRLMEAGRSDEEDDDEGVIDGTRMDHLSRGQQLVWCAVAKGL